MFERPGNILVFGLRNTKIESIDGEALSELKNLERLHVFSNPLKKLSEKAFANLKNLEVLELSNNKLVYLPENVFENNENLQEIDMRNNKLKIIDSGVFANLDRLTSLNLRGNECVNKFWPDDVATLRIINGIVKDACVNPLVDQIHELKELVRQAAKNASNLQKQDEVKDEQLQLKDEAIVQKMRVIEALKTNISKLELEKESNLIRGEEMTEELNVLRMNHTEAQAKIEETFNKIIALELNITETENKLLVALNENADLSLENTELRINLESYELNVTSLSGDLSKLSEEMEATEQNLNQTEKNFQDLQSKYSDLRKAHDDLESEFEELNQALNETETLEHLSEAQHEDLKSQRDIFLVMIIASSGCCLTLAGLIVAQYMRNKKEKIYSTNEMDEIYSHPDEIHH